MEKEYFPKAEVNKCCKYIFKRKQKSEHINRSSLYLFPGTTDIDMFFFK